jgi:hypothetical protein
VVFQSTERGGAILIMDTWYPLHTFLEIFPPNLPYTDGNLAGPNFKSSAGFNPETCGVTCPHSKHMTTLTDDDLVNFYLAAQHPTNISIYA